VLRRPRLGHVAQRFPDFQHERVPAALVNGVHPPQPAGEETGPRAGRQAGGVPCARKMPGCPARTAAITCWADGFAITRVPATTAGTVPSPPMMAPVMECQPGDKMGA